MTDHDMKNVKFLLNVDEATMRDWHAKATPDDHVYAKEILEQYHLEMKEKLALLHLSDPTKIIDSSLASAILWKYRK